MLGFGSSHWYVSIFLATTGKMNKISQTIASMNRITFSRWSNFKDMRIILMSPSFVTATHIQTHYVSLRSVNYFYHFICSLCPLSLNPPGWPLWVLIIFSMVLKLLVWQSSGQASLHSPNNVDRASLHTSVSIHLMLKSIMGFSLLQCKIQKFRKTFKICHDMVFVCISNIIPHHQPL